MSLSADQIYALLPALYRTADAGAGAPLQALLGVAAEQAGVLEQDLQGLHADQFIETCAPWVVPYIGDLIGRTLLLAGAPGGDGGRAEVANTIGYRRRKGTVIALEQLGADITGRSARAVEYFKRLAVDQSFRHLRLDAGGTVDLRDGGALDRLGGPFDTSSRTVDVRRIAPRVRSVPVPDRAPLDVALHGGGRFNIPDIGAWVWRWIAYAVTDQPAFAVDEQRFLFSPLGADMPLFNMAAARQPFDHLTARADVAQPIERREFALDPAAFYGPEQGLAIHADGNIVQPGDISVCDLSDIASGDDWAPGRPGKVAIDPVRGRIAFPPDQPPPETVTVSYGYGFPADLGGGPYDRTERLPLDRETITWQMVVGAGATDIFGLPLTLEAAVAAFNTQPAGATGVILVAGFGVSAVDLTGPAAPRIPPESQLWIIAAEIHGPGPDAGWSPVRARGTLHGDIDIIGTDDPADTDDTAPMGQLFVSGLLLAGGIRVLGRRLSVTLQDCTAVPGRALMRDREPVDRFAPSISVEAVGAALTLERAITGPLRIDPSASARVTDSIVDATAPWLVAFAGLDGTGEGGSLHVENSTIIGKLRAHALPLASNTIFLARRPAFDPWRAAVWCTRRQSGCVRFSFVPSDALTPPQYRCLPGDPALEHALAPQFVSLHYGGPSYGLLSGACPVAVWNGADDESQIGACHLLYEAQGVANCRARLDEYLPFGLEAGIFLIPSRSELAAPLPEGPYGMPRFGLELPEPPDDALQWLAIGASLI
ncbi:MAG: hypothetical protein ACREET_00545 [Stellaceae bacterium]